MVSDPAMVAPTMGEMEGYAEGIRPVAPETLYIVFPVAKYNVEVWLHMGLGIMPTG